MTSFAGLEILGATPQLEPDDKRTELSTVLHLANGLLGVAEREIIEAEMQAARSEVDQELLDAAELNVDAAAGWDGRDEWTVRLLEDRVDPSTVPPVRRCTYVGGRSEWPAHLTTATRMGRIRQTLIDVKGGQCHACGLRTGVICPI